MFMDRFFVSKKLDQIDPAFDYSFILIGILGLEPKHPGTRILCLTNLAISQYITRTRIELVTPP